MSARETLLVAIGAVLAAIPNATFYRSRESAVARDEGTVILLQPEEESVEKRAHGPDIVFRRLIIVVTVITRATVPDSLADEFCRLVQLNLLANPTMGGLCAQIVEQGTKWTFNEADLTAGMAEIRFDVLYQTLASDLLAMQ